MHSMRHGDFLGGLAAGVLAAVAIGAALAYTPNGEGLMHLPPLGEIVTWTNRNLGMSSGVFALILGLYLHSLLSLNRLIRQSRPVDEVARAEHLTDTWTSLFFGIGIIWTAIGMRSALIYALGDPQATLQGDALAMLQRMVEGGILLALSTTIVGGIGGYLMRLIKELAVGAALQGYYGHAARESSADIQTTLNAIEAHLHSMVRNLPPKRPVP